MGNLYLTKVRLYCTGLISAQRRHEFAQDIREDAPFQSCVTVHLPGRVMREFERDVREPFLVRISIYTDRTLSQGEIEKALAMIQDYAGGKYGGGRTRAVARPTVQWDDRRPDYELDGDECPAEVKQWWPTRVLHQSSEGAIRMNPWQLGLDEKAQRLPAEDAPVTKREIEALRKVDQMQGNHVPENWKMSPELVIHYILGGVRVDTLKGEINRIPTRPSKPKDHEVDITPKYEGEKHLVEVAIGALIARQGLLLVGEPGTAKSRLSEHLAAAISGDSTLTIQGTAGTTEEQIRYSWDYALLLSKGKNRDALRPSPVFLAMGEGKIARFEEITRCPPEVQDALISILSEKLLTIPELEDPPGSGKVAMLQAQPGFTVIATANTRDRGVNEMSSALRRRFVPVILPLPRTVEAEVGIVMRRLESEVLDLELRAPPVPAEAVRKVVTIFRELRAGDTTDKTQKLKKLSGTLSTAEVLTTMLTAVSISSAFNKGQVVGDREIAEAVVSTVIRDEVADLKAFDEYVNRVMRRRPEWAGLYQATRGILASSFGLAEPEAP